MIFNEFIVFRNHVVSATLQGSLINQLTTSGTYQSAVMLQKMYFEICGGLKYQLGMSTVTYTATAVLLTVTIRPQTVPYISRIHELESPRRYGTVITTAGIRLMTAVRDKVA